MAAGPAAQPEAPHAIDAEQALLGAILHNGDAIDGVRHIISAEDFHEGLNGHIYEAMCVRRDAGEPIDFNMMRAVFGNADVGGLRFGEYLARITASATTISGAPGYARMIRSAAQMRKLLQTSTDAVQMMTAGGISDPTDYAARMIEELDEVASSGLSEGLRRVLLGESAKNVIARVSEARQGRVKHGAPFGLPDLDRATLGMREDQLIILAGRPGMGKTTAAVHFAMTAARHGHGVGFVSLEMNANELAERALSAAAYDPRQMESISYRAICEGVGISDMGFARLRRAQQFLDSLPLLVEQQPGLTISQIAARARQMKLKFERSGTPMGVLIIDHIGLVRPSKRYAGNRVQEMTEISGALKGLAKELSIPVLALSQLNRTLEGRPDKRPILSDLRDSGSIEQDADVVLSLFREAYYLEHEANPTPEQTDRLARVQNTLEIEILKQRSGPTTRIECFCDVACNVIAEMGR